MKTIKLTAAQALVRYLCSQQVMVVEQAESLGKTSNMCQAPHKKTSLFAGGFAIFGHGNVAGIGQALFEHSKQLPTYRAHNEQAMAHSAIAYAKAMRCQRMMFCTSSIGPGATNMVTAAAVAYVNRLPLLLLPGDIFATRHPDPVLQQGENPADATASVNDCFRPVSCFWDRITRPEQLLHSLPNAIAVLTDAARRGPVTISMPQDIQSFAYDFPVEFFKPRLREIRRIEPDKNELQNVLAAIAKSEKPFIVSGGGVLYSQAEKELANIADERGIAVGETQAGKGALSFAHKYNMGAIGVTGTAAANEMAKEADLVLAVGTRLQDFTTASRSLFQNPKAQIIQLNTTAHDTVKHNAMPLVADALVGLQSIDANLGNWKSSAAWREKAQEKQASWNKTSAKLCSYDVKIRDVKTRDVKTMDVKTMNKRLPSDAEVVGAVNNFCDGNTTVVCAAGSLPAELHKHWRSDNPLTYHVEYGYSCMGYEIAGALGVKMAYPTRDIVVMVGDGSYLMLNSELATSCMLGIKIILVILDNRGYGCINRLQSACGGDKFNNLLDHKNTIHKNPSKVDFAMHAKSLGADVEKLDNLTEMPAALARAMESKNSYAIVLDTDPEISTKEGGTWWEVGVPEVSQKPAVRKAYKAQLAGKKKQRL